MVVEAGNRLLYSTEKRLEVFSAARLSHLGRAVASACTHGRRHVRTKIREV